MKTQQELYARQHHWETWKALATILAAVAVMSGAIIGLSRWVSPARDQPMFPPGTVITIPAAPAR